jgi:guanine deaminase
MRPRRPAHTASWLWGSCRDDARARPSRLFGYHTIAVSTDAAWLDLAIDLAVANVDDGGGPFGAVVVIGGELVGSGTNRVTPNLDPTAHAEVQAIRSACRARGDFVLEGATLYSSCEPCPMCLATSLWSRVDRVVYAADRFAAAAAGFDDVRFSSLMVATEGEWPLKIEHLEVDATGAPFDAWSRKADRVPY